MKHSIRLGFAGALLAAGLPMAAMAQVPVTVSVNVQGSCSISTPTNAAYGNFTSFAASTTVAWEGSVVLRCNRNATPFVAVSYGNHATGTQRFMQNANGDLIGYSILKPTISGTNFTTCPAVGAGTAWGDSASGTGRLDASGAFTASGGNSTINLCVQATITDVMATGLHTDIVVVSAALN